MSGKGLQEVPNQHVLLGIFISGRGQLTEGEMGGMRGLSVLRCSSAAVVCTQNVTMCLSCGGGGWCNTRNLNCFVFGVVLLTSDKFGCLESNSSWQTSASSDQLPYN